MKLFEDRVIDFRNDAEAWCEVWIRALKADILGRNTPFLTLVIPHLTIIEGDVSFDTMFTY